MPFELLPYNQNREDKIDTVFIVELDLSRYRDISQSLEESIDASTTKKLNLQIQSFIKEGLLAIHKSEIKIPQKNTGDGAIITLTCADEAVNFAIAVHKATENHNATKTKEIALRYFRIGVYKGKVIVDKEHSVSDNIYYFEFHGSAIGKAVALEAACLTGEILICVKTFEDLSDEQRKLFGPLEIVKGKRTEQLKAHRLKVIAPAPWDKCDSLPVMPKHEVTISKLAYGVAKILCERSQSGLEWDPEIEIDELSEILNEQKDIIEEVFDELSEYDLVTIEELAGGSITISPKMKLFIWFDPVVKDWNPSEDAIEIANILMNWATDELPLWEIGPVTNWSSRRINPAVYFLEINDVVEVIDGCGQGDLIYPYIAKTSKTRSFLKSVCHK